MNVLKLQNNYSWLNSTDDILKTSLWKSLRFRRKNYFMSPLYKQRKWDGFDDFFKRDSGRFLTGLLPEVRKALYDLNKPFKVIDERGCFPIESDPIDDQYLNKWLIEGKKPITLHDYQVDYINQVGQIQRGIVRAPTGAGKSFIMVGMLKRLPPGTPTLILTKSKDLTYQIYDDIAAWQFPNLGKVIGSKKKDFKPNIITVANVDSVHKIDDLLPHFRCLMVDEVHAMMSKVPKTVYKRMERASIRIGLSATPFKFGETDKSQMYETKGFFGPVIKFQGRVLSTKELQERDVLSPSKCIFYPVEEPELPYETYQDAVTLGIAESIPFNKMVAKLAKKIKGRTLIIVERINQGEILQQLIPGSHWVYGQDTTEARKQVITLLQSSDKCVCIVQQKLISAGINVFIHNMICAMGGKADHDVIQRLGRGLRRADDKESLCYYDFVFNINDYLFDHSNHRMSVLRNEGHEVIEMSEFDI
jgi:superfamily II DNA or RNA helicase